MVGWREFSKGLRQNWQRSALLQRWQLLLPPDRLALTLLTVFILLVLLYLFLWIPIQLNLLSARAAFAEQRELYTYMQSNASALRGGGQKSRSSFDQARLQGVVTALAAEHGLAIDRLDVDGQGMLQVSFQPLPFTQLLNCVRLLEAEGVKVKGANIDRFDDGLVVSRLTLGG